ncbi:MAG: hypothetical protein ACLR23_07560, partial [Clostridia bacterium]
LLNWLAFAQDCEACVGSRYFLGKAHVQEEKKKIHVVWGGTLGSLGLGSGGAGIFPGSLAFLQPSSCRGLPVPSTKADSSSKDLLHVSFSLIEFAASSI